MLDEVIGLARGRIQLMVELKTPSRHGSPAVAAPTVSLVGDDDAIVCFQRAALEEVRRLRPGLRTVQHVGLGVSIRGARGAWAAGFHDPRLTRRGLAAATSLGLVPLVYTVNAEHRMRDLAALGVAGIFTDRPELLLRLRREGLL